MKKPWRNLAQLMVASAAMGAASGYSSAVASEIPLAQSLDRGELGRFGGAAYVTTISPTTGSRPVKDNFQAEIFLYGTDPNVDLSTRQYADGIKVGGEDVTTDSNGEATITPMLTWPGGSTRTLSTRFVIGNSEYPASTGDVSNVRIKNSVILYPTKIIGVSDVDEMVVANMIDPYLTPGTTLTAVDPIFAQCDADDIVQFQNQVLTNTSVTISYNGETLDCTDNSALYAAGTANGDTDCGVFTTWFDCGPVAQCYEEFNDLANLYCEFEGGGRWCIPIFVVDNAIASGHYVKTFGMPGMNGEFIVVPEDGSSGAVQTLAHELVHALVQSKHCQDYTTPGADGLCDNSDCTANPDTNIMCSGSSVTDLSSAQCDVLYQGIGIRTESDATDQMSQVQDLN